jgi:hypothetical protein
MPRQARAIPIAADGRIYIGNVGTTPPTDVTTAFPAGWDDIGWISQDGATLSVEKTTESYRVWGQLYAIKYFVTDATASLAFVIAQLDSTTLPVIFGGGSVAETASGSGVYRYTPGTASEIYEKAMALEWKEGTFTSRLLIPRVMPTAGTELQLSPTTPATPGATFGIVGTDGVAEFEILSNHPDWAQ